MNRAGGVSAGELLLYRFKGRALKLCVSLGVGLSAAALLPALLSTEDRGRRFAAVALLLIFWLLADRLRRRSNWVPDVLVDRRWVLVAAALTAVPYAIDGHAQSDAFMGLAPLAGVAATTCRRREVIAFAAISIGAYLGGVILGGGGIGVLTAAERPFDGVQQVAAIAACCGLSAFAVLGFRRFTEGMPGAVEPDAPVEGDTVTSPSETEEPESRDIGGGREAPPVLTEREREVIELLATGMERPEIAERLVISKDAVKSRFDSAKSKLGVRTQEEAVAVYLRLRDEDG